MKARIFVAYSLIIALSMYLVPYLFLGRVAELWASYAYWVAVTILHALLTYLYFKGRGEGRGG